MKLYNCLGQDVITLHDCFLAPGDYTATWNGKTSAGACAESGVYLYELRTGNTREVMKLLNIQ